MKLQIGSWPAVNENQRGGLGVGRGVVSKMHNVLPQAQLVVVEVRVEEVLLCLPVKLCAPVVQQLLQAIASL